MSCHKCVIAGQVQLKSQRSARHESHNTHRRFSVIGPRLFASGLPFRRGMDLDFIVLIFPPYRPRLPFGLLHLTHTAQQIINHQVLSELAKAG